VFSVTDLIATLGVEEDARAKDTHGKKAHEEGSSANLVQKKNFHAAQRKKKNKPAVKPKTATFKKKGKEKEKGLCFVCGASDHWAKECPDRKDKQKKTANMVVSESGGSGYGNHLPTVG
jgi:hypothetical protein